MTAWFPVLAAVAIAASPASPPDRARPVPVVLAQAQPGGTASVDPFPSAEPEPGAEQPERSLVSAARAEIAAGAFEQAIAHLNEASDQLPHDPEIASLMAQAKAKGADSYVAIGKKLLAERKYDDARVAFDNALELVPGQATALKGKDAARKWPAAETYCKTARDFLEKGNWDEAIANYERAYALTHDASIGKWLEAAKAAKAAKAKQRRPS